jgi:hypothetical protein
MENVNLESDRIELSRKILSKLDNYACSNGQRNEDFSKEEIGFCAKCNKMIAHKFTKCVSCTKHYCKAHREAHNCPGAVGGSNCFKAKLVDGKGMFMDRLRQMKIKSSVK